MFNKLIGRKFFLTKKDKLYNYPKNIRIVKESDCCELLVAVNEDSECKFTITRKELFSYYCGIRPHFVLCCRTVYNTNVRRNVIITMNTFVDENITKEEVRDIHIMYYRMYEQSVMELDYRKDMREEGFDENGVINLVNERLYGQYNTTIVRSYHLCYGYITDRLEDLFNIVPIKRYLNTFKQLCMWRKIQYSPLLNYLDMYCYDITKRKYVDMDSWKVLNPLNSAINLGSFNYTDPEIKLLLSSVLYYNFGYIDDIDLRTVKIFKYDLRSEINIWRKAYPKYESIALLFKDKQCYVIIFKKKPIEERIINDDSAISQEEWAIFKSISK